MQAVQGAHALREFAEKHPNIDREWYAKSNYLAFLAVDNKEKLLNLIEKAIARKINIAIFREPDLDDQITAIVLEPGLDSRRLCSHIKLMGR